MKKAKKLVVGNWKMNPPSVAEAKKIAGDVKRGLRMVKKTDVVLCPPYVYFGMLSHIPRKNLFLGAQDAFYEPLGSYTGEVSYTQLLDFKVSHVILGHSERRAKGETDDIINKKMRVVVGEGMTAILCVGEASRDRDGNYLEFIKHQVTKALRDISKKSLDHVVIAYEPLFAVGGKYAMTPSDIHEISIYIKKVLRDLYGPTADGMRILYGGAVDAANAHDIVKNGFVSGLLVGRESLKPKNFLEIIKEVDSL